MTVTTVTTHEDREPPFPSFSPKMFFLSSTVPHPRERHLQRVYFKAYSRAALTRCPAVLKL